MTVTLVVMGVSGSGKTTLARALAERLQWRFAEGDDFHPPANVAAMAAGTALTDDDRWPWLQAVGGWVTARERDGEHAVVTCSALMRSYRDLLREGRPSVRFVHVTVSAEQLRSRLERRQQHYMPASLLPSQLSALEPLQPDEPGWTLPGDGPVEQLVTGLVARLDRPSSAAETGQDD